MQQLPRTIINPLIGYSVTFLKAASETGGAYTYVEVILPPDGGTVMHYHLDFTEKFEAVEGTLGLQLGKEIIHLQPGQKAALVPLRAIHRFFNPGKAPIRFRATISPARRFEDLLRITYGLTRDGKSNAKGIPRNIWHLALVYEIGESYLPGIPLALQKAVFGLLARIARWLGKHKDLEHYFVGIIEPLQPWSDKPQYSNNKSAGVVN